MVCLGKQPSTIQEKRVCTSSGFVQVFSHADEKMDLPTFPIVLVSNGIHHIVGTKLITASKLVDWRMNLSQFHLAQSQKLWQEAQVDMLMEPGNPDSEYIRVLDNTFNQLASTTKQLLDLRAKKATGTSKIIDCNILTTDKPPSNPHKGTLKTFGTHPELPSEPDIDVITSAAATSTTATSTTSSITKASSEFSSPPLPSLPLMAGQSSSMPIAISSESDVEPVPTSNPIPSSQLITISSGFNQGKPTGKKRLKRSELSKQAQSQPLPRKRCIRCTFPGCSHTEQRKNDMDDHVFTKHQNGVYNCSGCTKTFLRKRSKVSHIRTAHEGKPRKTCKYEGCTFTTNDYGKYLPHLFTEHGEGEELKCLHCNQTFTNERVYDYHITNKHEPKQFQCSECNRYYKTKFRLEEHWVRYHGQKPENMCHICGKAFTNEKVMAVHISSHTKEQVAKAEILEEISEAERRVAEKRKPSAAAGSAAAAAASGEAASPSPTPSEIATAEPVGTSNNPTVAELMSSGHRVVEEQEGFTVLEVSPDVHADLGADK